MTCDVCTGELPADQHVAVNNINCHADGCFAQALRRMQFQVAEIIVALDSSMKPATAYKAGQSYVATIVAARRRTKKPKPPTEPPTT
jgi:hypothetical protein